MDNKVFGTTFLAIILSALLFFGVANAGSYAVDQWIFPTKEFGEDTYIGTTNVSDMELASASMALSGPIEAWKSSAELQVAYQDAVADYPLENVEVLLDETVEKAQDGSKNAFVFRLSPDTTRAFLTEQFPVVNFTDEQVKAVNNKIELALAEGQSQTRVVISDESIGLTPQKIAEASFAHNLQNPGVQEVLDSLNSYVIAPNSQFSFLTFINALEIQKMSDTELSEIASALYTLILQTNFIIEERSIGTKIPVTVPLGQEAAINRNLGIDLVFTNPNDNSFTMNFSEDGSFLTASLSGYPFVYTYEILTGRQEKVEPRMIKQYSAFASAGTSLKEPGSQGIRVEVLRSVINEGVELELQPISTDFYPPVHRVEVYPLESPVVDVTPSENSSPENGETSGEPNDSSTGTDNASVSDSPDSNETETGTGDSENTGDADADAENNQESSNPVYDKSGTLIKP